MATGKRQINAVIDQAMTSLDHLGLEREHPGYWTAMRNGVQWQIDVLHEPDYGEGVFRVGWGLLVAGAAEIYEANEGPGTQDATVGGDVGSLATHSRRMVMLCIEGGTMSSLYRLLWRTKPEPVDVLVAKISTWLSGPVTSLFQSVTSRHQVIELLENRQTWLGRTEMHPDSRESGLVIIAALRALDGDASGAMKALDAWRSMVDSSPTLLAKADRIATRIRRVSR